MGTKKRLNKKKKLMRTFLKSMLGTVIVCVVGGISVVACYNYFFKHDGGATKEEGKKTWGKKEEKAPDIYKNIAVFGVDKDGYRTDVIFVVNFNSVTNKVKALSLPRDTKVNWSEEQKQSLRDLGKYTVSTSKLNEMTAYGGIDNIRSFTINQIENMLGITIDNYVIVDINAFNKIVDAIGGVDLEVPQDMYYTDSAGGLYINLKAGYQHLDGDQAEQLVRFRRYKNGDVDRIATQQIFLKAFAEKVLSPSTLTKIPELVEILFGSITTDLSIIELPQYYKYLSSFDKENISFFTLPGEGGYEGGVSYFFPDYDAIDQVVQEVFFDKTPAGQEAVTGEEAEVVIDKTVSIAILNGSGITGAAAKEQERLVAEGYSVGEVGNFTHTDVEATYVIAKDETKGQQFKTYYPNAEITTNPSLTTDIQIIIGKDIEQQ